VEQYVNSLLGRYRSAGVLVDANLLLLYVVGAYDRGQVERFRRTRDRFAAEDFDTLSHVLVQFDKVVTTPHILTEVSNMMGQMSGYVRDGSFELFARSVSLMTEKHTAATDLSKNPTFVKFGITDASIRDVASGYLVLTDDLPLYGYLAGQSVDVLNFNNLRPLGYQ
jgi:hypothetical protein